MQQTPERQSEISEYYRIAPEIVHRIDRSGRAEEVYRSLCNDYILPAVRAVEKGRYAVAHRLYKTMVETLTARYLDDDRETSARATGAVTRPASTNKGARKC